MKNGINIVREVKDLTQRVRGRACIVLTHDHAEQKAWAAKLAEQAGAFHVDLLDHFISVPDLTVDVGKFTVQKVFRLLGAMKGHKILVVSGIEFLMATWAGQKNAMTQFVHQVEYWEKSPAFLFVMQHEKFLASWRFTRYPQYKFVVDQKETFALI